MLEEAKELIKMLVLLLVVLLSGLFSYKFLSMTFAPAKVQLKARPAYEFTEFCLNGQVYYQYSNSFSIKFSDEGKPILCNMDEIPDPTEVLQKEIDGNGTR